MIKYYLELMRMSLIVYIILVQLWVAGKKAQPSSGHMREKRPYPSFCTKSGRMSDMLGSGKDFSISPSYVMSDDIIDIQDPRYHMRRRTFFEPVRGFAGAWMALRARYPSPRGLAILNPLSTCLGPRPGPQLARGVRVGSLRSTEP